MKLLEFLSDHYSKIEIVTLLNNDPEEKYEVFCSTELKGFRDQSGRDQSGIGASLHDALHDAVMNCLHGHNEMCSKCKYPLREVPWEDEFKYIEKPTNIPCIWCGRIESEHLPIEDTIHLWGDGINGKLCQEDKSSQFYTPRPKFFERYLAKKTNTTSRPK